jgi:hypothetical protein
VEKKEEGDERWKRGLINETEENTGEMGKEYTEGTVEQRNGMREVS